MIKLLSSAALSAAVIAALAVPASANNLRASYGVSVVGKDVTMLSFDQGRDGLASSGTVSRDVVRPKDYARGRFHETRTQRLESRSQPEEFRPSLRRGLAAIGR